MAGALGVVLTGDTVPVEGRAAVPVYVDDSLPIVGPSRACVVVTIGPMAGGPPMAVRLAPAGTPALGPALPVYVVSGSLGANLLVALNSRVAGMGDSITDSNGGQNNVRIRGNSMGAYLGYATIAGNGRITHDEIYATIGYTVNQIRTTHLPEVLAANPAPGACVVLAGTNDVLSMTNQAAIDARLADLAAIYDALLGANILPVACAIPACEAGGGGAAIQASINTYNAGIQALASARRIPFADLHVVTADPVTGLWLPDYDTDGIHPSNIGARAMGAPLWGALAGSLSASPVDLVVTGDDASSDILLWGGRFVVDSNADGVPDGGAGTLASGFWTRPQGSSDASWSLVSGASDGVDGNWWRINKTANTTTTLARSGNIPVTDGARLGIGFYLKVPTVGAAASQLQIQVYKATDSLVKLAALTLTQDLVGFNPFIFWTEATVPASCANVKIDIALSGGTMDISLGQLTIRDISTVTSTALLLEDNATALLLEDNTTALLLE